MIDKMPGGLRNKRTSGDHPNYNIIESSQNTEKSPGDLRRLAVTQTPVRNHRLTLMWKTWKGVTSIKIIMIISIFTGIFFHLLIKKNFFIINDVGRDTKFITTML